MHKALLIVFIILFSFENSLISILNSIQKIDMTEHIEEDFENGEESEKKLKEEINFTQKYYSQNSALSNILTTIKHLYFSSEANCVQNIVIESVYSPPE